MHYWYGCIDTPFKEYRHHLPRFRFITDTIQLKRDLGNMIPDKSWMLYLLEVFNIQKRAVELNLICQFDGQDYFEAIFNGRNQYRFRKVLPQVGNTFYREIKFLDKESTIEYYLKDMDLGIDENFRLAVNKELFAFQFYQSFTGIEWWNRVGYEPYRIRYEAFVSNLMYGYNDNKLDPDSKIFFPIGTTYENKDGSRNSYPIDLNMMNRINGCISYTVT
jgi:hypothetical protein